MARIRGTGLRFIRQLGAMVTREYHRLREKAIRQGTWHPSYQHASTAHATHSPCVAELAWAAGFIEGEGCFNTNNGGCFTRVVQKDPEALTRLLAYFGGSIK